MTSFRVFLALLFLVWGVTPVFAVRPPQAKLLDAQASPKCLQVRPSWLANVPEAAGDISGAAVSVTNNCGENIIINDALISPSDETIVGEVIATKAKGYIQYIGLKRLPDGIGCFADAPPAVVKDLRCKTVTLRPEDTLIVPVPWGTHYEILGPDNVKATGWMLNPADPKQVMDVLMKGSGAAPPPQ
ncbi:MAG: hypothetical protein ACAH83_18975 [Alphaproteobacteria bacterium]